MATSGRGSGVVGYNVQASVDTTHHLIATHKVTNVGNDRSQLAPMSKKTKAALEVEKLDVVADRGYFDSGQILECDRADITVTLPKSQTSTAKARGRFGKQDFRYVADGDVYICPASERLAFRYSTIENGLTLSVTGRMSVKTAPSGINAPPAGSAALPAGSTNIFLKRSRRDSTPIRRRCVSAGKRSSIPSEPSRCGWDQPTF